MKTKVRKPHSGSATRKMIMPMAGIKPVLALLKRVVWPIVLLLPAFCARAGVVFTTLHSFQLFPNGANPQAALVQARDGNLYGTTCEGGTNNAGTVFQISTNGILTTLYSFTGGNDGGWLQAGLAQGRDGNFYGTTEYGGQGGAGNVFRVSTNGALTILYAFGSITNASGVALDGASPAGTLIQASDDSFYGTTANGGQGGAGTVFWLTIVPQPQLSITPFGPYIILTWPTNNLVFTLQSSTNLDSSVNWNTHSLAPALIGGQNVVINPITSSQMFYRLQLAQ